MLRLSLEAVVGLLHREERLCCLPPHHVFCKCSF
jgi:hypothetical protein